MNNTTDTVVSAINAMFAKRTQGRGIVSRVGDLPPTIKPIYCKDGSSLSVQASRSHYSIPRNDEGPYLCVEVGFPSAPPPESWRHYCDGDFDKKPCDTVYASIPVSLVAEFVKLHGGIKLEEVPKYVAPAPAPEPKRSPAEQRRYKLVLQDIGLRSSGMLA